jgi:hypothetical protein
MQRSLTFAAVIEEPPLGGDPSRAIAPGIARSCGRT